MTKGCECAQVRLNNPDKSFEELIKLGLICEDCANSYWEFCKFAESLPKEEEEASADGK